MSAGEVSFYFLTPFTQRGVVWGGQQLGSVARILPTPGGFGDTSLANEALRFGVEETPRFSLGAVYGGWFLGVVFGERCSECPSHRQARRGTRGGLSCCSSSKRTGARREVLLGGLVRCFSTRREPLFMWRGLDVCVCSGSAHTRVHLSSVGVFCLFLPDFVPALNLSLGFVEWAVAFLPRLLPPALNL